MIRSTRTNGQHAPAAKSNGHASLAKNSGAVTPGRLNGRASAAKSNGRGAARVNGHALDAVPTGRANSREQAQALTGLLLRLMRELLVMDDATAELPLRQLRVCALLHEGPLPMSALSRELGVSLSATTQIADRLKRARLVKRVAEESDRRVRSLQLTPRGKKIMQLRESARFDRVLVALEKLPAKSRNNVLTSFTTLLQASTATKK